MKDPTAEEFSSWITPSQVLAALPREWPVEHGKAAIVSRLGDGMIRAYSANAVIRMRGLVQRVGLGEVAAHYWREPNRTYASRFWTVGDVEFDDSPPEQIVYTFPSNMPDLSGPTWTASFTGVRLDPADALREFGVAPTPSAPAPAPKGRRPAGWWDDLWIEICRQVYVGALIPDSQAAIERAMHDWLAARGEEAGETTVRDRARRLFRALDDEVGK